MTKREKISILKKALKWLEYRHAVGLYGDGICMALGRFEPEDVDIQLPERKYDRNGFAGNGYYWPITAKGGAIRRRVLKNAIKRLEK